MRVPNQTQTSYVNVWCCGGVIVSADERCRSGESGAAADGVGRCVCCGVDGVPLAGFAASYARLGEIARFLDGKDAACLEHSELESRLELDGRELLRTLFEDHLALRALREQRAGVVDSSGVARRAVERGHERGLQSVFGEVTITTTDRYLSAKVRPEELERLDQAFGVAPMDGQHGKVQSVIAQTRQSTS